MASVEEMNNMLHAWTAAQSRDKSSNTRSRKIKNSTGMLNLSDNCISTTMRKKCIAWPKNRRPCPCPSQSLDWPCLDQPTLDWPDLACGVKTMASHMALALLLCAVVAAQVL